MRGQGDSHVEALNSGNFSKMDMLIEATRDLWCTGGSGELSARALGAAAGLSPSMIYYHFSDVEHLYLAAQAESIADAGRWCDAQTVMLDALGEHLPADTFAPVLAQLTDSFCTDQRRLALAWRECQILAARRPLFRPARAAWTGLWRDFWQRTCERFGLGEVADMVHYFFEGEGCLHLMPWNRAADRAALDEAARAWGGWLIGGVCREAPWRRELVAQARRLSAAVELRGETLQRIAAAAARLLLAEGPGAINHRAVAAEAGLTLGVVSHNCKRTDDLLQLAHAEVYRGLAEGQVGPDVAPHLQVLALDELVIAVARGRADRNFTLQLRYLRGSTTRALLAQMAPDVGEDVRDLAAATYSSVMMGAARVSADLPADEAALVALRDSVLNLVAGLGRH